MKTKNRNRADIRLTDEEADFIEKNDLSKSRIFNLGLKIARISIEDGSTEITLLRNGIECVYTVRDK